MNYYSSFVLSAIGLLAIAIFVTGESEPEPKVALLLKSVGVKPGSLKYQASVQRNKKHICGGALISTSHVLSASHCFTSTPPHTQNIEIVTGATSLSKGGERHLPKYVKLHPGWKFGQIPNDIAVITLTAPVMINELQAPISLPSGSIALNSTVIGRVSGWGQMGNGKFPDILQEASVTIIPQDTCKKKILRLRAKGPTLKDNLLCGFDGHDAGICGSDSGNPLVYNDEVVGIASASTKKCGLGPNLYARVSSHRQFIDEAMKIV